MRSVYLHSAFTLNTGGGRQESWRAGWYIPGLAWRRFARLAPDHPASPGSASGMRSRGCRSSRLIGGALECWRRPHRLVHKWIGMTAARGLPLLLRM